MCSLELREVDFGEKTDQKFTRRQFYLIKFAWLLSIIAHCPFALGLKFSSAGNMIEEPKWYEKLHSQCRKCKEYDAVRFIDELEGFYVFNCRFCGNVKKRPVIKGSWEMKDGKTFVNGIESRIKINNKGMKIVRVKHDLGFIYH